MTQNSSKIDESKTILRRRAQETRNPEILTILRSLKSEILLCLDSGHGSYAIFCSLQRTWGFSQPAFYTAWAKFLGEVGRATSRRKKSSAYVVDPPMATSKPSLLHAAPGQPIQARVPPKGSAIEALSRRSVSDLIRDAETQTLTKV